MSKEIKYLIFALVLGSLVSFYVLYKATRHARSKTPSATLYKTDVV